jgi:hypothetical protein
MTSKNSPKSSRWHAPKIPISATTRVYELIEQGSIVREGDWYRVYDIRVLGEELFGMVRRLLVSNEEVLVKLY